MLNITNGLLIINAGYGKTMVLRNFIHFVFLMVFMIITMITVYHLHPMIVLSYGTNSMIYLMILMKMEKCLTVFLRMSILKVKACFHWMIVEIMKGFLRIK